MLTGLYAKLIIAGVILAAIVGYGEWRNNAGYNKSEALWTAKYSKREADLIEKADKERSRQIIANNEAKALEAIRIAKLEAENDALENHIKDLENEAALDPDADKPSLSPAGRLRVNSVR